MTFWVFDLHADPVKSNTHTHTHGRTTNCLSLPPDKMYSEKYLENEESSSVAPSGSYPATRGPSCTRLCLQLEPIWHTVNVSSIKSRSTPPRPQTWNVSRAGDNLHASLLSRHKGTTARGSAAEDTLERFRAADSTEQITFGGVLLAFDVILFFLT